MKIQNVRDTISENINTSKQKSVSQCHESVVFSEQFFARLSRNVCFAILLCFEDKAKILANLNKNMISKE